MGDHNGSKPALNQPLNIAPGFEALAPHSVEAEEAVLGGILVNPDAIFDCLDLRPDEFFLMRHAWAWEAILHLHAEHVPVDQLTLTDRLEQVGHLAEVGGAAWVLGLINKTPSALNVAGYAGIVKDRAVRRQAINLASEIARLAHEGEVPIEELKNQIQGRAMAVTREGAGKHFMTWDDYLARDTDRVLGVRTGQLVPSRAKTHIASIDGYLGVFYKQCSYLVAGRPGMGKTGFLATVAYENIRRGIPVGVLSLEMGDQSFGQRVMSIISGIPTEKLAGGALDNEDWKTFTAMSGQHAGLPLVVDDTPSISPEAMERKAREMIYDHGIELLIIDYVQLMTGGSMFHGNTREQEISWISQSIVATAKRLDIPVLSAAQLSRACEERSNKRPILSDLRESGSLEQDAFGVMFIYRESYYDEMADPHVAEINVAKHRIGKTGKSQVIWHGPTAKFAGIARTDYYDLGDF